MRRPPESRAAGAAGAHLFDEAVGRAVHETFRLFDCEPVEADEGRLSHDERELVDRVETYLRRGLDLRRWWRSASSREGFAERVDLGATFNRPESSYGFFDEARVGGEPMRLMGNYQEMAYDRPKAPRADRAAAAGWIRDQMREFVFRYFMRVSDFRQPQAYTAGDGQRPGGLLRPVSLCPEDSAARIGFGFSQLLYKLRRSGEVGRFPQEQRFRIVDLRDLEERFEWIVAKVAIYNFSFSYSPLGAGGPSLTLPLAEESYLVLSRDFVAAEESPGEGDLARYGIGYAFIRNPRSGLLAYGPGEFDAAIEQFEFRVRSDGRVRVGMVFVTNRPERIVNLPLDPIEWSLGVADRLSGGAASRLAAPARAVFDALPLRGAGVDPVLGSIRLLNLATGGLAERELCIARRTLEMQFLVKHFMQHYEAVAGSLHTWRQIPDWLDRAALPKWVIDGQSS